MKRLIIASMLVLFPIMAFSQAISLSGIVKDDVGVVLPGVSVTIGGTTHGVITNQEGVFRIEVDLAEAQARARAVA